MSANQSYPPLLGSSRTAILTCLSLSAIVYVLMMVFGFLMRSTQAEWLGIDATVFYRLMTAHGAGMVGISGLAGSTVLWYFLRRHVNLSVMILWTNLAFFLLGVVCILGGIFAGGYAGGWTFLFPLPSHGLGMWGNAGAASFLIGLLLIGVGFLLLYLDMARAILAKYGSLGNALGWPQLFKNSSTEPPATPVVAGTMVLIVNIAGIISGAVVLVLMLVNLFMPEFAVDPLLTKNLTYFFGHVFINATIYQAVVAVYEIIPEYTNRPWKVNKVFLAAWTASTVMVMAVYPHHLLMDFVMPTWALVMGQIISYVGGFPILIVTAWGALTIVHRSGIKWDLTSSLLFLSMFGWAVGVVPAVIDGTIAVNKVMHNTMWVPGHFHMYLIVGLVAMMFGFKFYLTREKGVFSFFDKLVFWIYAVGGASLSFAFLLSGYNSIPRRWAQHLPEWVEYSQFGAAAALVVATMAALLAVKFLVGLKGARAA